MKCYYHEERDAVGTCQDCGIALCKECASKYTPCLCPDCAKKRESKNEIEKKRNKSDHLYNVKKEFWFAMGRGLIVAIIILIISAATGITKDGLAPVVSTAIFGFFASFGWMWSAPFKASIDGNVMMEILMFVLRLAVSFFVGIPCCIFYIIKYVKGVETNRKM